MFRKHRIREFVKGVFFCFLGGNPDVSIRSGDVISLLVINDAKICDEKITNLESWCPCVALEP